MEPCIADSISTPTWGRDFPTTRHCSPSSRRPTWPAGSTPATTRRCGRSAVGRSSRGSRWALSRHTATGRASVVETSRSASMRCTATCCEQVEASAGGRLGGRGGGLIHQAAWCALQPSGARRRACRGGGGGMRAVCAAGAGVCLVRGCIALADRRLASDFGEFFADRAYDARGSSGAAVRVGSGDRRPRAGRPRGCGSWFESSTVRVSRGRRSSSRGRQHLCPWRQSGGARAGSSRARQPRGVRALM